MLKTAEDVFWDSGEFLQTFLTEEKRPFPNVTIRQYGVGQTGKIAGSPRDVVDSGMLRDSFSQKTIFEGGTLRVSTDWDAPHAEIVYAGTKSIPPYPWVTIGLREIDWDYLFKTNWAKYDN
jgi:hypothetical protein